MPGGLPALSANSYGTCQSLLSRRYFSARLGKLLAPSLRSGFTVIRMDTPDTRTELTAAECAARTALTARALRLYEEHGLIAPRRSAGGWRQYGPDELVRLNAITLLKTAGLTLAQIGSIMGPRSHGPGLEHMLAIQLENWRTRRADAERGQRIVEAALGRLNSGGSLTVDDLCNLIRSLEMSQQQESSSAESGKSDPVDIDEAILDSYAGDYRLSEWNVVTVKREGTKLFLQPPARSPVELRPTSERDFEMLDIGGQPVTFDLAPDGAVSSLRLRVKGGDVTAERVDGATAEHIRARLAARIQEQKPLEGSGAAVRRLVEGLISGQPNYDEMAPALAHVARQQIHRLHTTAAYLGAIQSIEFQGVGSQGWDVYDVHHERGTSRVRIMQRSDGVISGALLVVKDGPVSLGP